MKILVASPRGFCAGVVRAIDIVRIALERFPPPIYVRKEIVHNRAVVDDFRSRGVIFIDSLKEAPPHSRVIFSAHGVSPKVREQAQQKNLTIIDATCPLVTRVHLEVHRYIREGYTPVLIGHRNHDEVQGTLGEAPETIQLVGTPENVKTIKVCDPNKIIILTQTTLSLDETKNIVASIQERFPFAKTPPSNDICYATQNRQDAVKKLVGLGAEALLVVGSKNSSNSQRLVEVGRQSGCMAYLIDEAKEIQANWLKDLKVIGVTAGASAPEHLVQGVLSDLIQNYRGQVQEIVVREENVHFSLPKELA